MGASQCCALQTINGILKSILEIKEQPVNRGKNLGDMGSTIGLEYEQQCSTLAEAEPL